MAHAANRHHLFDRVSEEIVFADRLIGQLMHKAAVRPIFQQTPHQIGQQVAMPTDRRISAAMISLFTDEPFEQAFAHTVQPLKFEIAVLACPFEQRGDGQGVMAGKSGPDIGRREHIFRTSQI